MSQLSQKLQSNPFIFSVYLKIYTNEFVKWFQPLCVPHRRYWRSDGGDSDDDDGDNKEDDSDRFSKCQKFGLIP